jgi:hypothetical protein
VAGPPRAKKEKKKKGLVGLALWKGHCLVAEPPVAAATTTIPPSSSPQTLLSLVTNLLSVLLSSLTTKLLSLLYLVSLLLPPLVRKPCHSLPPPFLSLHSSLRTQGPNPNPNNRTKSKHQEVMANQSIK